MFKVSKKTSNLNTTPDKIPNKKYNKYYLHLLKRIIKRRHLNDNKNFGKTVRGSDK